MRLSSPAPPCCCRIWCETGLLSATHFVLLSAEVGTSATLVPQFARKDHSRRLVKRQPTSFCRRFCLHLQGCSTKGEETPPPTPQQQMTRLVFHNNWSLRSQQSHTGLIQTATYTKLILPGVVVDDGVKRLDQRFKHTFALCVDHRDPSQLQATQGVHLTHQTMEGSALGATCSVTLVDQSV